MENNKDQINKEAFSVNQIKAERPNIKRSVNILPGFIATSMNGGHNKTIHYKRILPGEKHVVTRLQAQIQQLTPLTPSFQPLYATIRCYWVPDSAIYDKAYEFVAQKGGASIDKVTELPNLGGKVIPKITNGNDGNTLTYLQNTALWRDSFISSYIKRIGTHRQTSTPSIDNWPHTTAKENALKLRGRVLIYNEKERNKEFDQEMPIYKGDTVSGAEWESYLPTEEKYLDFYTMRAKRPDSYYTNYRTELQGFESAYPPSGLTPTNALIDWMQWEQNYSEAKKQAMDSQREVYSIIAEMYGAKELEERRVLTLGEKTFELNYASVTQNAYNDSAARDEFKVLGKQGAYSYTNIDLALYSGAEFKEPGYLHVIMTVWADTVFSSGIDRLELNVKALEQYRPELAESQKHDVLYKIETRSNYDFETDWQNAQGQILGFKRKYSEYFKQNTSVSGDMLNKPCYGYYHENGMINMGLYDGDTEILPNNTYQFFEDNPDYDNEIDSNTYEKKHWRDYTDIEINKNLAIMEDIIHTDQAIYRGSNQGGIVLGGQNQIFMVGRIYTYADLPVDEAIKQDYLKWGEH